jgi:L-amino acid N-acyltransferase YncA
VRRFADVDYEPEESGSTPAIRLATGHDAREISAIYAPIVEHTIISFEVEPPTEDEMRRRIWHTLEHLPWLVCERHGRVAGYAYASEHSARAAYQWSVNVSAYVHERERRTGVGRALYTSLSTVLALQGFYNAYAGISLPNPASVSLHEAVGFKPVGIYHSVGYKLGTWHDVGWWQLSLQEHITSPDPPINLRTTQASAEWDAALASGLPLLQDHR